MTTKEFLQREIRRTDIAIRRAERKPNAPEDELRGLREKRDHLQVALAAVDDYWRRVHQERGWFDKDIDDAYQELRRRFFGEV